MSIEIKHYNGKTLYVAEDASDVRQALEQAVLRGTVLSGAVLSGADLHGAVLRGAVLRGAVLSGTDLSGAVLSGAVLRDAVLSGADLSDAVLSGAVLSGAVLSGAVLSGAVLSGADLRGADLRGAVLRDAVLRDAVLRGAVLSGAVLSGAVLSGAVLRDAVLRDAVLRDADLSGFRSDLFGVLDHAAAEVAGLRQIVVEGRMDGTVYESGENHCGCLVGSIAAARGCDIEQLAEIGIRRNSTRPAEQWVYAIRPGDTPSNAEDASEGAWRAHQLVAWIDEWTESRLAIAKLIGGAA